MNLTYPTALVLEALARGHGHGFDICDATGLASGTVYPILRRLEREGIVRARWERVEEARREHRPPRRYYDLTTGAGRAWLDAARARFRSAAPLLAAGNPRPSKA